MYYASHVIQNSSGKQKHETLAVADLDYAKAIFFTEFLEPLPEDEKIGATHRFCNAFGPVQLILNNEQVRAIVESSVSKYLGLLIAEAERRIDNMEHAEALNIQAWGNPDIAMPLFHKKGNIKITVTTRWPRGYLIIFYNFFCSSRQLLYE